ncbi:MAG: T9SS type B sorting domain-containing protein [Lutibacter sp.]|uniref:T9SS type B sorting domain-containing protein n=1 Tax=Lutibacter sp. TaxID=1925666 RepID=UPI0019F6C085|nr:gliding motility-associated C-terminal domain-containing protein [Lutibacter sp.]NOR27270.1 T9SS type B sorting domain-containing protein [Lutibacter sp.]
MKKKYVPQRNPKNTISHKVLITLVSFLLFTNLVFSQTKGLIFEPATGAGKAVLDPNGDGYVSNSTAGFINNDRTESEIPYVPFIFPGIEPTSDINNGPNGGFTDFVDSGTEDPTMSYVDANNNWLFRFRMGSVRPNAKSYSILIDTDGLFGNSGASADPDYTLSNPGFEVEIVLATKFGVYVYDVDGTPNCTPVIEYLGTTNYQKSIAHSEIFNPENYFLDFFVPFGDLAPYGITATSNIRMAIIDNMAALKSTVCNPSSASDVAGVGPCENLADCFEEIIDNQGPCSLEDINAGLCIEKSACPAISGSLGFGDTTISGTSTEADLTTIEVFKNGSSIGTTTVSGGSWTLTGISPALASDDIIIATATAPSKSVSDNDCNTTIVVSCSAVTAAPDPSDIVKISGNKGFDLTVNRPIGTIIRWYNSSGVLMGTTGLTAPGNVNPATTTISPDFISFECQTGQCFPSDLYIFTYEEPGKCESAYTYDCQYSSGVDTADPTITTSPIISTTTSISGAMTAPDNVIGITVNLMSNGIQIGTTTTIAGGSWTINSLSLNSCDNISVNAIAPDKCISLNPATITVSGGTSEIPEINGDYCTTGSISTVTGISSEEVGTTITVYVNGTPLVPTTTVTSGGVWSLTGVSISSGSTITATATASGACKIESPVSSGVVVSTQSSNTGLTITTNPIIEQTISISGTGNDGDIITLYVDDFQVDGVSATVSGGVWTISGIPSYELYTEGIVTVKASGGGSCESAPSAESTVVCISPLINRTVNPDSETICSGSFVANIDVLSSESLIVYQLYLADGTTPTGTSVLGNGLDITLTSGVLTSSTTLRVKAFKIPPGTCEAFLTETITVTVNALPNLSLNVLTTTPICSGSSTNVQIESSEADVVYQLRNDSNDAAIGSPVNGNGGTINLPTGNLTSDTTFNILATGASPSNCNGELTNKVTVLVTEIPVAPTVTVNNGCGTSTLTASNYTGTLLWSNGETTASIIVSNLATYTVTQNIGGCISLTGGGTSAPNPIPPAPTGLNCWETAILNNMTCLWEITGVQDTEPPVVNCWDNFVFNTSTCVWDNIGVQDTEPPVVNCWDNFVFNTSTCVWDNTGVQDAEPPVVNCWDNFVFNTSTCVWDNTGVQDAEPPVVNCWDNFVFNTSTCVWDNTGVQDAEPSVVNCWDNFVFNTSTCVWDNIGVQDAEPPVVNCWDNFVFNTSTCVWDNTGVQDAEPTGLECWEIATFNNVSCLWEVTVSLTSDCDGDGVKDVDELFPPDGEDPTDPTDSCDYIVSDVTETITSDADCDGDGVKDVDELFPPDGEDPTDPTDPCDYIVSDVTETQNLEWSLLDCDGDGTTNGDENQGEELNPCLDNGTLGDEDLSNSIFVNADCDGDGVINGDEIDPDGDGSLGPNETDWNDPCDYTESDITVNVTSTITCIVPEVSDDEYFIENLDAITIDIYENDNSIPIIGTITVSNPNMGTVFVDNNGTPDDLTDDVFVYQPNSDYVGEDSFTYTICDTYGNCDTATVIISGVGVLANCIIDFTGKNNNSAYGFSPNGDGYNDTFVIDFLENCYPNYQIQIFNRWGNVLFDYTHNGDTNMKPIWWDGKSSGRMTLNKNEIAPVGTYFFIIYPNNGIQKSIAGYIYLTK